MEKKLSTASLAGLRVGLFPFGADQNPYQRMIAEALASAGFAPYALPKQNWFALRWAAAQPMDVLQMYWPHSLYHGASGFKSWLKRLMFYDGLRALDRVPFLYSVENLFPHDAADEVFEKSMIQRLVDHADGHLVMSRVSGEIFQRAYRLKPGAECYHVPHRNYLDIYPNTIARADARARLQLPPNAPVVLFLGRLLWYKGLDRLISAFLSADESEAVLLLAGKPVKPDFVPTLQRHIAEYRTPRSGVVRVEAKFIPEADIQVYMNAADLVALPYADMPMNPGSLILAMGFGKAIVSPAKGATPEITGDYALFGYDENAADGLETALHQALSATDLAARGREASERARLNHSKERVAVAFREAYERLAARLNA